MHSMINKKTFLKNILTTASSLAITMGASEAMAVPSVQATSLGGISHTSQNTGGGIWHGDGSSLSNGDSVLLTFANDTLNITTNVNIAGIDLNNLTSITGAITSNSSGNGSSIGSIGHAGAGGVIALHINNGIGITLTGTQTVGGVVAANTYSGLGAVTLGSTTGGAAGTGGAATQRAARRG